MFVRTTVHATVAALLFLAPVALSPAHLATPAPWIAFLMTIILLGSQPRLDVREAASRTAADRGSALLIFGAMIGTQVIAVLDFARRPAPTISVGMLAGPLVIVAGLGIRLWAIHTLGRSFTSTVRVAEGQSVVTCGPYRWLRHPSYTGAILVAVGVAVSFGSVAGLVAVAVLCVPAYVYRVTVEESALVAELGDAYTRYRAHSWRLVPGVY